MFYARDTPARSRGAPHLHSWSLPRQTNRTNWCIVYTGLRTVSPPTCTSIPSLPRRLTIHRVILLRHANSTSTRYKDRLFIFYFIFVLTVTLLEGMECRLFVDFIMESVRVENVESFCKVEPQFRQTFACKGMRELLVDRR